MVRAMSKPLRAGGEVDSWCTKCKLVLNHRIIAMVGSEPARVECSTCGSHHNFRARAPGEKVERAARAPSSRSSGSGASSARGPSKVQVAAMDRERTWERAVSGKGVHDFRPYRVSETFAEGDLIKHSKFGDGVVMRVVDPRKVEILFKDDARTLAQGLVD